MATTKGNKVHDPNIHPRASAHFGNTYVPNSVGPISVIMNMNISCKIFREKIDTYALEHMPMASWIALRFGE